MSTLIPIRPNELGNRGGRSPVLALVRSCCCGVVFSVLAQIGLRAQPAPAVSPGAGTPAARLAPELEKKIGILVDLQQKGPAADPSAGLSDLEKAASGRAKDKVRNNDLAGAEEVFAAVNPFESGTGPWSMRAGHGWLGLAQEMSRERDLTKVPAAVTRALQHFDDAAARSRAKGDAAAESSARMSAGFVHERFRGDPASALASYRAAVQANPSDRAAKEALVRMEKSLANLRARLDGRK